MDKGGEIEKYLREGLAKFGIADDSFLTTVIEGCGYSFKKQEMADIKKRLAGIAEYIKIGIDSYSTINLIDDVGKQIAELEMELKRLTTVKDETDKLISEMQQGTITRVEYTQESLKHLKKLSRWTNNLSAGYYIFGGDANVGKSAIMQTLTIDILNSLPKSKILYCSFDDSKIDTLKRFVACQSAYTNVFDKSYNNQQVPIFMVDHRCDLENKERLRQHSFLRVNDYVSSGSLQIKSEDEYSDGNELRRLIDYFSEEGVQDKYIFIDAVRKIRTPWLRTQIEKEEWRADLLHNISNKHNIPIITTHEIIKDPFRRGAPKLSDLKGTGEYQYNAKFVAMLDYKDKDKFDKKEDFTINCTVVKNKLFSERGKLELVAIPQCAFFSEQYGE